MNAYEVIGTRFIVAKARLRRWFVYEGPLTAGAAPVAGPFTTRAAGVLWAIENEVIPVD